MTGQENQAVVWQFCDGKAGHERQSAGLINALRATQKIATFRLETADAHVSVFQILRRLFPVADKLPDPDFILGAGRACQLPMLLAQRARGGRTIYLMKPALPSRLFDLCLIPRHDGVKPHPHIIATDGVINNIVASGLAKEQGLILIGGPSSHYRWDRASLLRQIKKIIADTPDKEWVIADSRRTPNTTAESLRQLHSASVTIMHHQNSPAGWLEDRFAKSNCIWVTGDSMSMLFESLSCGAGVGILDVPIKRKSRITDVVNDLLSRGMVTSFANWNGGLPSSNNRPFTEAARCASLITSRWSNRDFEAR